MERTPTPTRQLRQAIESVMADEDLDYLVEEDYLKTPEQIESDRRAGRRLPDLWTRVISVRQSKVEDLKTFILHQDLEVAGSMVRPPLKRQREGDKEMVYWPDKELSGQTDLSLEKHTLKETKLKSYAKQISQIRSRLREQAYQAAKEDFQPALELDQKYLSRLLDRIHKGYWP